MARRVAKRFRLGKPYAIYYLDHFAHSSKHAWVRPAEVDADPVELVTLGFVVKETDTMVAVGSTVDKVFDRKETVGNVWYIVKSAITNVVALDIDGVESENAEQG